MTQNNNSSILRSVADRQHRPATIAGGRKSVAEPGKRHHRPGRIEGGREALLPRSLDVPQPGSALPMTIFMPKSLRTVRVMGAFVMASLLAACTSTADIRAADTHQCRSYGFRPGTDAFSQCLLDVDLNRAAERRALLNRPHFGVGFGYGFGPRRNWW